MATSRRKAADSVAPNVPANAITADYVMGLYRYGLTHQEERGLRSFIRLSEELFDMRHRVSIPKEYRAITKEIRTPLYRDAGLRIAGSLVKDPPYIGVPGRDETAQAKKAASIATQFLMAVLNDMDAATGEDLMFKSSRDLTFDSESVIKVVHRPDAWANFPGYTPGAQAPETYTAGAHRYAKGSVTQPFAARVVDRRQMLFGDGEYGDEWCLEYGEYSKPYLAQKYGMLTPTYSEDVTPATELAGKPQPEPGEGGLSVGGIGGKSVKVEYFETGEDGQWAVLINGQMAPGFPRPNPYAPFLPYVRTTSFPALYALTYLVPALDGLLTMKYNWAHLSSYPIPMMEPIRGLQQVLDAGPVGNTDEPNANQTWRPGRLYFPPPDRVLKFLEVPGTGRDVDEMIAQVREMIDVAGVPSVFRGIGGARQPGYSINQLMAAAQLNYKQLGNSLQRQHSGVGKLILHMVKKTIGLPVYATGEDKDQKHWFGVKPTGNVTEECAPIDLLGPVKSTFRPVLPTDEEADAMIGMQAFTSKWMSHATTLERYAHVEDADAEIDRLWAEAALDDPALNMELMTEARRRKGLPVPQMAAQIAPPVQAGGATEEFTPNDATNSGEPTVRGMTQPLRPARRATPPIANGGRPAGSFPGRPGGPNA